MSGVRGTNVGIIPFLSLFCSLIHALTKPTKLKRSRAEKTRRFDTKRLIEMESRSYILLLFHSLVLNVAKSGS